MNTYWTIQTLGFAMGTALFSMLALLTRRAERLAGQRNYGPEAAALGMMWNLGNLVLCVAALSGVSLSSLPLSVVNAVSYSALAWLSTMFFLRQPMDQNREQSSRWWRRSLTGSFLLAAGLTGGFFAAALWPDFPIGFSTLMKATAYSLGLHVGMSVWRLQGKRAVKAVRPHARAQIWLMAGLAAGVLLLSNAPLGNDWSRTLRVITQQAGIPFALIAFASLVRFRFADLFIKRSFALLAALITALLYAQLIVEPLTRLARAAPRRPQAAAWIVTALLWSALLLLVPTLMRQLYRAIDRWLFRRPDYRQLIQTFARESEQIADEVQLFALAEARIQAALEVSQVRVLPCAEVPLSAAETAQEMIHLPSSHPARAVLGGPEVELLIPVRAQTVADHLLALAPGDGGRKLLSDELAFLSAIAERLERKLEALRFEGERQERQLREARLRQSLAESELKALQAQINPHFLFNTLNTIADLISSEPEKAEVMTEQLAEVFRYVLARSTGDLITVREEFDFLRSYLAIEQTRFGDRLRVEMSLDDDAAAARIPSLILQPLVENAVKHGLSRQPEGGTLTITAAAQGETIELTIADDGVGWSETPRSSSSSSGVGLKNVRERLQALYGARASLRIRSSAGQGAQIIAQIPKDADQNSDCRRRGFSPVAVAKIARRAS